MHPSQQDIASQIVTVDACSSETAGAPALIVAAGAGDATKVTGQSINRLVNGAMANSAQISTAFLAALTAAKTLSLAHEIQESADGSSWDAAEVLQAATVVETGAGNKRGTHAPAALALDLTKRKQYFRVNVTPDLSNTATDTATFHTQAVLAGFDVLPQ